MVFRFYVGLILNLKLSKGEWQCRSLSLQRHLTNRKKEQRKRKVNDNQMEDAKNSNSELYEIIPVPFIEGKKKLHS